MECKQPRVGENKNMENCPGGGSRIGIVKFALCYAFVLQCLISTWSSVDNVKPGRYLSLVATLSKLIPHADESSPSHDVHNSKADSISERSLLSPPPPFHQDFVTPAAEREITKHDRLLFQGMAYTSSLTSRALQTKWTPTGHERPKLCINIFTCNRRVPYVDALMMSLMSGNSPERLMGFAKVNLMNLERRQDRMEFEHMRNTLSKIPFVDVYNVSQLESEENESNNEGSSSGVPTKTFRQGLILDTIRGLKLCVNSGLPWCLLLEEDAIFSKNFVEDVERHVIRPLEESSMLNETSLVSLYSYYNSYPNWRWNGRSFKVDANGKKRLESVEYGKQYEKDRFKTRAEIAATTRDATPDKSGFSFGKSEYPYGAVAQLYPIESVYILISYLEQQYPVAEQEKLDADLLINRMDKFSQFSRRVRRQVEPSMANHIGFYSERMMVDGDINSHSQMNTDSRFTFN